MTDMGCAAHAYVRDGYSVIPIVGRTKRPPSSWTVFQTRPPTDLEIRFGWERTSHGIGVVCGRVSGGLEVVDFDKPGLVDEWRELLRQVDPNLADIVDETRTVRTPSGGIHIYLAHAGEVPGNRVFARPLDPFTLPGETKSRHVLIETRGEGGQVVAPPTPGYEHIGGDKLPVLTAAQWATIETVSAHFDETPHAQQPPPHAPADGLSPGRDYQRRGPPIAELLRANGWQDGKGGMVRPGKEPRDGISATIGKVTDDDGNPCLYVFSSAAAPFEQRKTYNRFAVYCLLFHGGDFTAAARQLASEGYGDARHTAPGAQKRPSEPRPGGDEYPSQGSTAKTAEATVFAHTPHSMLTTPAPERRWLLELVPRDDYRGYTEPMGCLGASLEGIIAAAGGTGKSMSAIQLAVAVASGTDWLSSYRPVRTGRVLLAMAEENADEIHRRLRSAAGLMGLSDAQRETCNENITPIGLHGIDVGIVGKERNGIDYTTPVFDSLCESIKAGGYILVIIDPLTNFGCSATETDQKSATYFIQCLRYMTTLGEKPNVVALHHYSKAAAGESRPGAGAARGVTALTNSARWQMNMDRMPVVEGHPKFVAITTPKQNYADDRSCVYAILDPRHNGALRKATDNELAAYRDDARAQKEKNKEQF